MTKDQLNQLARLSIAHLRATSALTGVLVSIAERMAEISPTDICAVSLLKNARQLQTLADGLGSSTAQLEKDWELV